jgi:hypothetical protein
VITEKASQYYAAFMILSGLMIGVFSALDGLLFYIFFEATLIPMYIIIGVWGGQNRIYAAFKFFLYTLLGSLLALVAILYLYNLTNTFDLLTWHRAKLDIVEQVLIFIAFFMAFAVKVPMWPLHTRCLWILALLVADCARCQHPFRTDYYFLIASGGDLRWFGGTGSARHEEVSGVLLNCAYGFCYPWLLYF